MQHRTRRQLEWTASEWSIVSCVFVLDYRLKEVPLYIFEHRPRIPPIRIAWSSFFGVIITRKNPRYFRVHISIYGQSRFEKNTTFQFNSIQSLLNSRCFRDLGANMPGVVNCQGNGETISSLGRGDSRFFKLQAIIWLSIILVSHQAIIRVTRRVTAENGAQTLRRDGG